MKTPISRLFLTLGLLLCAAAPLPALLAAPAAPQASAPQAAAPRAATALPVAETDDVAATERSVVRVVTVAMVNGEVVGFGHGSGFAISPTRIITNAHVVADAAEYPENVVIGIVPSEGTRSYSGRLVRIDTRRDLAIVELTQGRIPPAALYLGPVRQRSTVYALGYPGNVDLATAQNMDDFIRPRTPVASDGIISSTDTINGVAALVHDADIARGNSGGPLVDRCGRVLGVNSFVSRSDEGDSPFSFAMTVRELAGFLTDARQSFTSVTTECLSADEARARAQAMTAEERRAAEEAESRERELRASRTAEQLAIARAEAQESRENYIAFAMLLFGLAIISMSASFKYEIQKKPSERRASLIAAGLLAVGAVIIFLLRPSPADVRATVDRDVTAATAQPSVAAKTGALACTVDRSRGRLTVSEGQDTQLSFRADGCVNGRTQYVRGPEDIWTRTLVPNEDATISRLSYDPASGDYVVKRYLMSLESMETARRQRDSLSVQGCTADPATIARLTQREVALASMLPGEPHEEIVSRCRVSEAAADQPAPKASPRTP
jgi:S1-C subfamily serine protease